MIGFEAFAEMVETRCINTWRSVIGIEDADIIEKINTVVFSKRNDGDDWTFSFGLRMGDEWYQSSQTIEPVEYDILNPPPIDDAEACMNPQHKASTLAMSLINANVTRVRYACKQRY